MDLKKARIFQIFVILVFLFGTANLRPVLAQDETPVATDPTVVITDTPMEVITNQALTTEVPATEDLTEVPTQVANEFTATEIDLADAVELLNNENMEITNANGESLALGSQEAANALTKNDPFFYNNDPLLMDSNGVLLPVGWVGYSSDGTGCPDNVTCLKAEGLYANKPFSAALAVAAAGSTIYIANGTYNEDLIINTTNLSFNAFNSINVTNDIFPPTITNPGFAKVNSITLNKDFGNNIGVYADSVIVNTGGYVSDALNLVNSENVEATITAHMQLVGSGDYYRIQDINHTSDSYEWECGDPDPVIYPGSNYTMILKNPYSSDIMNFYTTKTDQRPDFAAMDSTAYLSKNYSSTEANLLLTAQERIADVISAASASESNGWSNMDEQRVFWNLLGYMQGDVDASNHAGALDKNLIDTAHQFDLAKQFAFTNNLALGEITQKLWFLWPSDGNSPVNTQLTFMKLPIPSTGCTDPAKCTSCPFGNELVANVGCVPIKCNIGNMLNAAGTGCEPIVCTIGEKNYSSMPSGYLTTGEHTCAPIVCTYNGTSQTSIPTGTTVVDGICVPITTPVSPIVPVIGGTPAALGIPVTGGLLIPVTGSPIIVAGLGHTCMTYGNSQVVCWGLNASGQVGDGTNINQLAPVYVKDLTGVVDLTAGSLHTCALDDNGDIWCWGENGSGQLGNGSNANSNIPVLVEGLPDKAIDVTGGEKFTCAQLKNAEVWCWGENGFGQLNDGTSINRNSPFKSLLENSQNAIAAGQEALLGDAAGTIDTWSNTLSALVKEIGSSLFLFGDRWNEGGCAVDMNGQVKCWDSSKISTPIEKSLPAYMVETGIGHGCALNLDGSVSCWGLNTYGQLGNGTNIDTTQAVDVKNITQAKDIGIGKYHSCALVSEGNIAMCWGENTFGQLGNNSTNNSNLPVFVIMPAIQ